MAQVVYWGGKFLLNLDLTVLLFTLISSVLSPYCYQDDHIQGFPFLLLFPLVPPQLQLFPAEIGHRCAGSLPLLRGEEHWLVN